MNLAPIDVIFKPSRALAALLLVAHGASAVLVSITPLPLWIKTIALAAIALSAWYNVRRYALLATHNAVRRLRILASGDVEIERANRERATLTGEQFIHPRLTIIRCRTDSNRRPIAIVIVPDMLDPETFRALRVRLKWRA